MLNGLPCTREFALNHSLLSAVGGQALLRFRACTTYKQIRVVHGAEGGIWRLTSRLVFLNSPGDSRSATRFAVVYSTSFVHYSSLLARRKALFNFHQELVRKKGVEPSRACAHTDLNRARLPVPPLPHSIKYTKTLFYLSTV